MPRADLNNRFAALNGGGRDDSCNDGVVRQEVLAESPGRHQIVQAESACGSADIMPTGSPSKYRASTAIALPVKRWS